jgi:hypothetical protein
VGWASKPFLGLYRQVPWTTLIGLTQLTQIGLGAAAMRLDISYTAMLKTFKIDFHYKHPLRNKNNIFILSVGKE